jgi:hypothetical protein
VRAREHGHVCTYKERQQRFWRCYLVLGSALVSEHALANCGPSDVSWYSFFHTLLFVGFVLLLLFWVKFIKSPRYSEL